MGKKRRRPAREGDAAETRLRKRGRVVSRQPSEKGPTSKEAVHPVLSRYYPRVRTLRQYLLDQLPASSKSRRRRIASLGVQGGSPAKTDSDHQQDQGIQSLATLLDSTLVGILREPSRSSDQDRQKHLAAFTQSQYKSTLASTDTGPTCPQAEIVDFVILTLFNRACFSYQKPQHILTHGLQRATVHNVDCNERGALPSNIPGVVTRFSNQNVLTLKRPPWTEVLGLLGESGEEIMMRLLLDCGIFSFVDRRKGTLCQISGVPLSELELLDREQGGLQKAEPILVNHAPVKTADTAAQDQNSNGHWTKDQGTAILRKPNSVIFLRRRMLYARVTLNAKGHVRFGLKRIHVLNRFPSATSPNSSDTVHVMKYLFPRQFGLHNVFTSSVDPRETADPFKDYTFREDEIARVKERRETRRRPFSTRAEPENDSGQHQRRSEIPKRLRGRAVELVQNLQRRTQLCSYTELLNYYCPAEQTGPPTFGPSPSQLGVSESNYDIKASASEQLVTQLSNPSPAGNGLGSVRLSRSQSQAGKSLVPKAKTCLTDYATSPSSVSAFCRAVLQKLVPNGFYGVGQEGQWNRQIVMRNVDRFIRMRRFESLSLHQVCKGLKVSCIPWLEPRSARPEAIFDSTNAKLSLSDLNKRTELLHELMYYIFDSLLIPIVRAHFYVTESQMHRNRLFYFRHDTWRALTAESLGNLKVSVFEEMKRDKAERALARRSLGYGTLRLLPKSLGTRPIINLRKRAVKQRYGRQALLAPSINSLLAPVYNVLNYEKAQDPAILGAGMDSVADVLPRLKVFKKDFLHRRQAEGVMPQERLPLYFVKLDIQSCFDTIPQHKLVRLIEKLVSEESYHVTKHVEIIPPKEHRQSKPIKRFVGKAAPAKEITSLPESVDSGKASGSRNAVFVDTGVQRQHAKEDLLDLLEEHVRGNLIKIGNKYFRQRNGIPQGSVLSSLLCNFFYGKLEQEVLAFLNCKQAMLLRLIDDFLLITWDSNLAMHFLEVMLKGQPEYGVTVNPDKSLVNFEAAVGGIKIPRLVGSLFPYCGILIDTYSLEIQKDRDRILSTGDPAAIAISDTLTVESNRTPGDSFKKKTLASFPFLLQTTYLDTTHNSLSVVLSGLHAAFVVCGMRMYRYLKSLSARARPSSAIIIRTIRDLINLAWKIIQSRGSQISESLPSRQQQNTGHRPECNIRRPQIEYLAAAAFRLVLGRKQTQFAAVLRWLELVGKAAKPTTDREAVKMRNVVREGEKIFEGWKF